MKLIYKNTLCMAILFIPFISSIKGISALGTLGMQLSVYPLLIGFGVWVIHVITTEQNVPLPIKCNWQYLECFLLWIIISGLLNFGNILELKYQDVEGTARYIVQTGAIYMYIAFAVMIYNVILKSENALDILQKWLYYSFLIAGTYSLLEVISFIDLNTMIGILSFVDELFRRNAQEGFFLGRIRSVSSEASYFGMYAGMILPWLVVGWLRTANHSLLWGLINVYLLILVILTYSRTGYVMIFVESVLILVLFYQRIKERIRNVVVLIAIFILSLSFFTVQLENTYTIDIGKVFMSLLDDSGQNLSNLARYSSQIAAAKMFTDNPLAGVGFGMYGFYAVDYYPSNAWTSIEIQAWGSDVVGGAWPPTHGLYVRLLAELGVVGFILWIAFICSLVKCLANVIKKINCEKERMQAKALLVSLVGSFLCGGNVDGFTVMGMWIFIAYSWAICHKYKYRKS